LPGLEPDGKLIWTYREAMVPPAMPKSLLVVGSGAIGIEFASFYRNAGRRGDRGRSAGPHPAGGGRGNLRLRPQGFEKQGMKILTGATVKKLKKGKDSVTAPSKQGRQDRDITVDRVILAVGIVGNVENIGLEGTG
jgi:dihydrolipoamide dehydrogenase